MRSSRRWIRIIVIAVLVLGGIAAAADFVVLQVFEGRIAKSTAQSMGAERVTVDLGGFPFTPRFVSGHLSDVDVDVYGASGSGVRIDHIQVRMAKVLYPAGKAFSLIKSRYATRIQITGRDVLARVEMQERDLLRLVNDKVPEATDVRITPAGVQITIPREGEGNASARFLPQFENGRVVLRLVGASDLPKWAVPIVQSVQSDVSLPQFPDGVRADIQLGNGVFTVEVAGPEVKIRIGEGHAK